MTAAGAAARLRSQFGWDGAPVTRRPALILLSGLPGTGKSYLAAAIAARYPAVVVRSDEVRKALIPDPTYSSGENGFVYLTCYALMDQLLRDGYVVVFDATNLQREGRKRARKIATAAGAPALTLVTTAPATVIAERLRQRAAGAVESYSSDADWGVHQKLAATMDAMTEPSREVDTSADLELVLADVGCFLGGAQRDVAPSGIERRRRTAEELSA
jgi:predicted kinase